MVINSSTYALLGQPRPGHAAKKARGPRLPILHRKILAHLALKATDAHGYAAIELEGYSVEEMDLAISALHHDGLVNAFFIGRSARPRFHPSSLTGEGRRAHERAVRASAS